MRLFEHYITELRDQHALGAGVKELTYYPPLYNLLNGIGKTLTPQVRCVMNLKNLGAGLPDGGLFTTDQFPKVIEDVPAEPGNPSRGVIEVKGTKDDAWVIAKGEQVSDYWGKYRQVLVTNLRDFVLLGQDSDGNQVKLETYRLAPNEKAFWAATNHPEKMAKEHEQLFSDFLKRVMLTAAPLTTPQDVAWFLASYAREARSRVESTDLTALTAVRTALEEALGISFKGRQGEHFFRSTLVQTLFYGVFSAWVLWSKEHPPTDEKAKFDWQKAVWSLRVPMIRALFYQLADPTKLEPLRLVEVLDWTAAALNRVDRPVFFKAFAEEHAVQYFYEPFLESFDPKLRKQLGVWYTPPEVARYMVERVDIVLREELGCPEGFASPNVYVLDPGTGTATYLVEVIKRIAKTVHQRGEDALAANDIKTAAMERVFGFEILPAPFVVAHLQLGLVLQNLGAPLSQAKNERASIYLTNALTGWDDVGTQKPLPNFPELETERDNAQEVKRKKPILVVLGNPPYNGIAGLAVGEERDLSNAYRKAKGTKQPQGQGLNDLYIRFYRMAERRIVETTGEGIVCFISNYSWLDGLSFSAMRERYLDVFDTIQIDSLNGDKFRTGKLTPEGKPDPSIFSTKRNREGIQVGIAIALLTRKRKHARAPSVQFRELWGKSKHKELLHDATHSGDVRYQTVTPPTELGLPFVPTRYDEDYLLWPLLPDLFPVSYPGVKTSRDDVVVDIDRDRLIHRMRQYFDPAVSDEQMSTIAPGAMQSDARFQASTVRGYLLNRGFLPDNVVRYTYRPFDVRWLYWEPETKLLDEKRTDYYDQAFDENLFLFTTGRTRKDDAEPALITECLSDLNCMDGGARGFPLYTRPTRTTLFEQLGANTPNVSSRATSYLASLTITERDLFYHCLAVLHSAAYRLANAGALRYDWPRIPLPDSRETLLASSELGQQVAALQDMGRPVSGVTVGTAVRPELNIIAIISRSTGGALDIDAGDLAVTAGWGSGGNGKATMPGGGKAVARAYTTQECAAIEEGAQALGISVDHMLKLFGTTTYDIYLNDVAYWRNIPADVWNYTMGGYQVMKKWLSYREYDIVGRALKSEEVREFRDVARRVTALLLLQPALDAAYGESKRWALRSQ